MRKLLLLGIIISLFSCKEENKPDYVIINGTVTNNDSDTAMINGHDFEVKIPISENGTFTDTLQIEKNGFYNLYIGRERTAIYLEKGENLSVKVDAKEFDESLSYEGDGAPENNYLAAKYLLSEQNGDMKKLYSLPEAEFKASLDKQHQSYDSLLTAQQINDEAFMALERNELIYNRASLIENYPVYHGYYSGNEDFQISSNFFDDLQKISYSDTTSFRSSLTYRQMVNAHLARVISEESKNEDYNKTLAYLKKVNETYPDGYAKDNLMFNYLQYGLTPDESIEEAFTIYKNSNPNPKNLAVITKNYNVLKNLTAGNPSPVFNYENNKGGTTSLEDLKGKYVYVDVWATWCGPCIKEIPSLKEVEEDYKNKNIQFVSISIDEQKDHEKWKTMISEKELGGIQLFADANWKSQFAQEYNINSIPRFIIIGPQGNIVSADAPRPSDPKLRTMFDNLM